MAVEGYAPWIIETIRKKLGYATTDDSHDNEVKKYLESGEKLSKSKHMVDSGQNKNGMQIKNKEDKNERG